MKRILSKNTTSGSLRAVLRSKMNFLGRKNKDMPMEVIVLAGGLGTRLAHVISDVPKPMASVVGKPFLEYILSGLAKQGVSKVVFAIGYKAECIIAHFGNSFENMQLVYSQEEHPLYTGGAVKKALNYCGEREVFIINGDTFFNISLNSMAEDYRAHCAQLSVAVKKMQNFDRYGVVHFTDDCWIRGFEKKKCRSCGYINGGVYLMEADLLKGYPEAFSFEKQVMEENGKKYRMRAFISDGYFVDIGMADDYYKAQKDFYLMFGREWLH